MMYAIGSNMPGYLPDDMDGPIVRDNADEAKRALIWEMLSDADNADDALATTLVHAAEDLNLTDVSGGFSVIVTDPSSDLGRCYWIEPYDDPR